MTGGLPPCFEERQPRREEYLQLLADRYLASARLWRRLAVWTNIILFLAEVAMIFLAPTWLVLLFASLIAIVAIVFHHAMERLQTQPLTLKDGSRHPLPPSRNSEKP